MEDQTLSRELIELSQQKWHWMSERSMDSLETLFHEKAVFVHMGATMNREQELEVIRSGRIHYKEIDIQEVSLQQVSPDTVILLNKIRLLAVVGGNEVTNPFVVTEVYVKQEAGWSLASLSFTRLLTPENGH